MDDNFELYMDSLKYIFDYITIGVQLEYGFTKISLPIFARITIEVQLGLKLRGTGCLGFESDTNGYGCFGVNGGGRKGGHEVERGTGSLGWIIGQDDDSIPGLTNQTFQINSFA